MPLTFLFPWFAVGGLLAAAAVVVAHLISARTRAPEPLPTTRFVPRLQERSAAMERRPRDMLLLLLRAGALALAGLALAAPITPPRAGPAVKVAIADVSGAADPGEVVRRAREVVGGNGRVVVADSTVRVIATGGVSDTGQTAAGPLSLTGALVSAIREAATLGAQGNPVELTIVSGFTGSAVDSATETVRALWPGLVQLVDVPASAPPAERGPVSFRGDDDDPLRATATLLPPGRGASTVIVRDAWTVLDSVTASEGAAVVYWPRTGMPRSFTARDTAADTVDGVWVDSYALVGRFSRDAFLATEDDARVVARWIDGSPAAVERRQGAGCVREVAIRVPEIGDLSISPGFRRIVEALTGPCGAIHDSVSLEEARRAMLAGEGPRQIALNTASSSLLRSSIAAPLLLLGLLALLAELALRRRW